MIMFICPACTCENKLDIIFTSFRKKKYFYTLFLIYKL